MAAINHICRSPHSRSLVRSVHYDALVLSILKSVQLRDGLVLVQHHQRERVAVTNVPIHILTLIPHVNYQKAGLGWYSHTERVNLLNCGLFRWLLPFYHEGIDRFFLFFLGCLCWGCCPLVYWLHHLNKLGGRNSVKILISSLCDLMVTLKYLILGRLSRVYRALHVRILWICRNFLFHLQTTTTKRECKCQNMKNSWFIRTYESLFSIKVANSWPIVQIGRFFHLGLII